MQLNRFEKSVATSVLSVSAAAGFLLLNQHFDHQRFEEKRSCYENLEGEDKTSCLEQVGSDAAVESALNLGATLGLLGGLAAGVQAYRALDKMPETAA